MPVQVLGLSEPPQAGDELRGAKDLATARTLGEARAQRFRLSGHNPVASAATGAKLEDLFEQIQRGETATLNLVLKADVQGSLEAVTESLRKLERDDVKLSFVHRGVGGITENDVQLARASNATIIGSTCARTAGPARWPRPPTSRSVPTRSFTSSWRTSKRPCSACSPRVRRGRHRRRRGA